MLDERNEIIARLAERIKTDPPSVSFLAIARVLMALFPRSELPDWVEILANGNDEYFEDVIEIALDDMEGDNDDHL